MKRISLFLLVVFVAIGAGTVAQETYFGKNKVRYKDFEWFYIQTRHFDIYFYENGYETAKFAAEVLENAYDEIVGELNYMIQRRIPIFVYNSQNDFQQTNIIPNLLPEGVGGFTELFKNRVVNPFMGSYEDFRHVLHHELTHAVTFDMLYGGSVGSLLSRQRFFQMPLWLAEGYAEYSSRHGWDYQSDMYVRDATINGYLSPPSYLGGFLAYKQGQAMVKYIADKYGEDKLGEVFRKGKILLTINKALKHSIGIEEKELWEDFSKEMKRRYWPEIAKRKEANEIGEQLTHAREDGSYFNEKPVWAPDGDKIAIFTDKSDYTEIVLISPHDGRTIKKLVKGERSGDLESLHAYVSGVSFSPDGRRMVFVAKSKGNDALVVYDVERTDVIKRRPYDFYNIVNPAWSPDGSKIAFSALKDNRRDLWIYYIEEDRLERITNDRFDDVEPSWMAGSDELVFASDRPHPQTPEVDTLDNPYVSPTAFMPGDFHYGYYNLFTLKLAEREVVPLDVGLGQNRVPLVSPDGAKLAFISNRNGIDNIYVAYLDSARSYAVTDILTGVRSISWSPEGDKLAFSAFHKGAFDIFVLKTLVPACENGILEPTDFTLGKYNLIDKTATLARRPEPDTPEVAPIADSISDAEYEAYEVDAEELASLLDSAAADTSAQASDSAQAGSSTTPEDSVVSETGLYGDEWVVVNPEVSPLDSLMLDVEDGNLSGPESGVLREPASFDSIPPPTEEGEYETRAYKVKFTPDYAGGGFAYDTFFGLRGQSLIVFSDYLGNHQFFIWTDLVNTLDQSNIQAYYLYNRKRTRIGVGGFHTKNFYLDSRDFLFSDRFYGLQLFFERPFSTFTRLELITSQYFIDRHYHDLYDPRDDRNSKISTGELSYVTDNIIWGITGPVNGRRAKLSLEGGINFFDANDIDFWAAELDYRKYWHFLREFSFALRFAGGASFGRTPKRYFLGGTTNWIGNRTVDAEVFEVENLYFADVVTPLRGIDYYELSGNRYALANLELRYPLIEYLALRFPIPLSLRRVQGALFVDFGSAWDSTDFKGGTSEGGKSRLLDIKSGFGFGMRANLGLFVLRYDMAWQTDYYSVAEKPTYYFSFGADF